METIQVPTVTLDDLQIFQANHFLGHDYTHVENGLDEPVADDDDLGFYLDGSKRTLTDEQIEIFRHSEIHSLLREKRLREEEDLTESREKEDLDKHEGTEVTVHGKQEDSGTATRGALDAKEALNGSRQSGHASKTKQQKSGSSTSNALDYAEDDSNQGSVQMNASPAPDPRFFRRRIVSYAD